MIKKINIIITLVIFFWNGLNVFGQVFPVSSSIIMPSPHPIFLPDYYEAGGSDLMVILNLVDFNTNSRDVKLKIYVEGENIEIITNSNFHPTQPITLTSGVPITLQGSDLLDYLNTNNVDVSGMTKAQLNQRGGKLPEGQYNFCVEVLDYKSGKELSQKICFNAYLFLEQPPILLEPECTNFVTPSNPQNVNFSWQIAGGASPTVSALSTYKLSIYEITNPNISDPKYAVDNSMAILVYESAETMLNTFNLNQNTILLQAGKKYVYRIQAIGPNGKEIYANDGNSEWCWFYYGFPSDGIISLTEPYEGKRFAKTEQKAFVWSASDKGIQGQPYDYKMTIVKKDTNQSSEEALADNQVYYEEILPTISTQDGASFLLAQNLDPDYEYAWKISASSEGQLVAESEPSIFFSHSLLEGFYASNQFVTVTQTYNSDINNLSGKARVPMSSDPSDFVDVEFSNLQLKSVVGMMVLNRGEINFDLSDREKMELTPDNSVNGKAHFEYSSGKIDRTGMRIKGGVVWDFPYVVKPGEDTEVITKQSEFSVNSEGKLTGEADLLSFSTTFLDPIDFKLKLAPSSFISVFEDKYLLKLKGSITLPEKIKNPNNEEVVLLIENHIEQLDYFSMTNVYTNGGIKPYKSMNLIVDPQYDAIIDFSEEESPDAYSGNKSWKGVYFSKSFIKLAVQDFDLSNQLVISSDTLLNFDLSSSGNKFWVDNKGLTFKSNFDVTTLITYNTFETSANFDLFIEKGIYKSNFNKLKGAIDLPFVSTQKKFEFELALKKEEVAEQGFLLNDFSELEIDYNPFGGENNMKLNVNNAVFRDNTFLALNLDINIPHFEANINGVQDFRIYGNQDIGFGGKGLSKVLDSPVIGYIDGNVPLEISEIGASFSGSDYALSYVGVIDLGPTIISAGSSETGGSPQVTISSVVKIESRYKKAGFKKVKPSIKPPEDTTGLVLKKIEIGDMDIEVNTPVLTGKGKLRWKDNDEKWGSTFEAGLDLNIKLPAEINCGGYLIAGRKKDDNYFYIDAYYEDVKGVGVAVTTATPVFNIVGIEGRLYHHMSPDVKKIEKGKPINLEVDGDLLFGAALYGQIIDAQSFGFNLQGDVGILLEMKGDIDDIDNIDATVSFKGAFLNTQNVRDPSGSVLADELKKEGTKAVVNEVMKSFLPKEFDKDDFTFKLGSDSANSAHITVLKNKGKDLKLRLDGDLTDTPKGSVSLKLPTKDFKIKISGDLDKNIVGKMTIGERGKEVIINASTAEDLKRFELDVNIKPKKIKIGGYAQIEEKVGGLNFKYDDYKVKLDADITNKKGNLDLEIKEFLLQGDIDPENKKGSFKIGIGSSKSLFLLGDLGCKKAEFAINYDGFEFSGLADQEKQEAAFKFKTESSMIDLIGSNDTSRFRINKDSDHYYIDVTKEIGTLDTKFGDYKLKAHVTDTTGMLYLKNNQKSAKLTTNFKGDLGSLELNDVGLEYNVLADKAKNRGKLKFGLDSKKINIDSDYNPNDSSYISLSVGDNLKATSLTAEGSTSFRSKKGSQDYSLYLNPNNKVGTFHIKDGMKLNGNVNQTTNQASLDYVKGEHKVWASLGGDSSKINYNFEGKVFEVLKKSGNFKAMTYRDPTIGYSQTMSFNPIGKLAKIEVIKGGKLFRLEGSKSLNSAFIETKLDSVIQLSGLIQDSIELINGDYKIVTDALIKNSKAFYKGKEGEVSIIKNSDLLKMNLINKDEKLSFGLNLTNENRFILYQKNEDTFETLCNEEDKTVKYSIIEDDFSLNLIGNSEIGSEKIDLSTDKIFISLIGNSSENKGDLTLENKELEISALGQVNKENSFLTLNIDVPNHEVNIAHKGESRKAFLNKGNEVKNVLTYTEEVQEASLSLGNKKIGLNSIANSLVCEDYTSIIKVYDNSYELVYNNQILKFENLKLYLDQNLLCDMNNTVSFDPVNGFQELVMIGDASVRVSLKGEDYRFTFIKSTSDSVDVIANNFTDIRMKSYSDGNEIVARRIGNILDAKFGNYGVECNIETKELKAYKGEDFQIFMDKDSTVSRLLNKYNFVATKDYQLTYNDENYIVNIKDKEHSIVSGNNIMKVSKDKSYYTKYDESTEVMYSNNEVDFLYNSSPIIIDKNKKLLKYIIQGAEYTLSKDEIHLINKDEILSLDSDNISLRTKDNQLINYNIKTKEIIANYNDYDLSVSGDKEILFKELEKELRVNPLSLHFAKEDKSMLVSDNSLSVKMTASDSILIENKIISVNSENKKAVVKIEEGILFSYQKEGVAIAINSDVIDMGGEMEDIYISKDSMGIFWEENFVRFTKSNLKFNCNQYSGGYIDWESVSASNGAQSYYVSKDELQAEIDDNNRANVGKFKFRGKTKPRIKMKTQNYEFVVCKDEAEITIEDKKYYIGISDVYMSLEDAEDNSNPINIVQQTSDGITFPIEDTPFKVSLLSAGNIMSFVDTSDYKARLDLDCDLNLRFQMEKGGKQVANLITNKATEIYGEVQLFDSTYLFDIYRDFEVPNVERTWLSFNHAEISSSRIAFEQFTEGEKGIQVFTKRDGNDYRAFAKGKGKGYLTFGVESPEIGEEVSTTVYRDSKLKLNVGKIGSADIADGALTAACWLDLCVPAIGPEKTKTVTMDGPQYISEISGAAGGWAYLDGEVELNIDVDSPKNTSLSGRGTVQTGLSLPVFKTVKPAPVDFKISQSGFEVNLAGKSKSKRARMHVYSAIGPEFNAYVKLKTSTEGLNSEFGFGSDMNISDSWSKSLTIAEVGCTFKASYDVVAAFDVNGSGSISVKGVPSFKSATVKLNAAASVSASGCELGTTASCTVRGTLKVEHSDKGLVAKGKVTASASVSGYTASFSKDIEKTL